MTGILRMEMRRLLSRRLLQVVLLLSVALPAVVVALFRPGPSDGAVTTEDVIVGSTVLAIWLLAPTFLVGACGVGPDRPAGPVAGPGGRPRRPMAVLAARLVPVLLAVTVLSFVVAALLVVAEWSAEAPGIGEPGLWGARVRMIGLTLVLVWVTAVLGLSLAMIGRNTTVAAAVLAAYVGFWDLPLLAVVSSSGEGIERFMFSMQALSWLAQPYEFGGSSLSGPFPRVEAGLTIGALAFAALAVAIIIEHRRARSSSDHPPRAAA